MGIINHDPYFHSFPRLPLPRLATKPPPASSSAVKLSPSSPDPVEDGWVSSLKRRSTLRHLKIAMDEHPFKKNLMCRCLSHAKKEDIQLLWINWVLWIVFNRKRRSHGALNWRTHRRQKPMISPWSSWRIQSSKTKNHRFEGRTGKTGFECWLKFPT